MKWQMKFMERFTQAKKTNSIMLHVADLWNILLKGVMDRKSLCTFKTSPEIFMIEKSVNDF